MTAARSIALLATGLLGALLMALPAAAAAAPAPLTGNVLVLLDRGGAGAAGASHSVRALTAQAGALPAGHSVPQIGLLTFRPPPGMSLSRLEAMLRGLPGVASVQPERRYVPRGVPNDPALSEQDPSDSLPYQWYLLQESFPAAWSVSDGAGALVGVIDTGIDATHPDLQTKIAAAVNQQDPADATGTARTDEVGHGTHVASLACAATGNGIGIAGAGDDCRMVTEKSDFSDSSIASSIIDATNRGVLALNMSFGPSDPTTSGPAPDSEVRALQYAAAHKVVLVAAAADSPSTEQGDPANVLQPAGTGPEAAQGLGLDVTAAQYGGQRASFAGSGSEISLAAYGAYSSSGSATAVPCTGPPVGVFAAYPGNSTSLEQFPPAACRTTYHGDDRYAYLAGTSMAAPQVAALGALMRRLNPDATLRDVLETIKLSATRPPGTGWSSDLGWGIVNADAALVAVAKIDRTPPVAQLTAPRISRRRRFALRWVGRDPQRPGLTASGIGHYLLYVSADGRRSRLLVRTTRTRFVFRGAPGHRYSFTVVAVDRAGNRERHPSRETTRVAAGAR